MVTELPEVAAFCLRLLRDLGVAVVLGYVLELSLDGFQFDPGCLKAHQGDIEAGGLQGLRLAAEGVLVVAGLAEQVVCMDEGPALVLAQILDRDGRHLIPAFRLGGQQSAVSVDHAILTVDADRDDHAKLAEGSAERFDLLRRVKFGVVFIRVKLGDLPQLHAGDCSHVSSWCVLCPRSSPRFVSAARARDARKP